MASVVIPCYNQGAFVDDAIASVVAQDYQPHEIILVNDGSTDDTPARAAKYPRVRYIEQPNRGLAAARNAGLRASRGQYVVFLDADDRLCAGALSAGVECVESHPDSAFAVGHYREIAPDGSVLSEPPEIEEGTDAYASFLRTCWVGLPAAVTFQRWVFDAVGPFEENPGVRGCEDYELYLRIARRFPVARHGRVVAEYRRHPGQMTGDAAMFMRNGFVVRRREWSHARTNDSYRAAYEHGSAIWRKYWGEPLAEQLGSALKARQWTVAARRLQILIRYWPEGLKLAASRTVAAVAAR